MDSNLHDPGDPPHTGRSGANVTSSALSCVVEVPMANDAEVLMVSDDRRDKSTELSMGLTKCSTEPSSPDNLRSPLCVQAVITNGSAPSTKQVSVEVGQDAPSTDSVVKGFSSAPNQSASTKSPSNAWVKPPQLNQTSNATTLSQPSGSTILMQTSKDLLAELSRESQWPSLKAASKAPSKRRHPVSTLTNSTQPLPTNSFSHAVTMQQDVGENDSEFPWASKMDKSKRNLHKVTSPVFLEDGTPKVRIPRHVLLEGLENQREFVFGQFYRCSAPAPGLIQSVVSRIWGTRCKIYTRQLGNNSFLFHIPDEQTRKWVIQRGIWHVDDCIMFVSSWDPKGTISLPEITTIPVWLTLKDIPLQLYSKKGISWIASGIGAPMLTSKPWLDPILMGEAKILVEVKLDRPFPQKVALEDESGTITMVSVIYSWLPSVCPKCGQLGHKAPRCLGLHPINKTAQFSDPKEVTETVEQVVTSMVNAPKDNIPPNDQTPQDSIVKLNSLPVTNSESLGHKDGSENNLTEPHGCVVTDQEGRGCNATNLTEPSTNSKTTEISAVDTIVSVGKETSPSPSATTTSEGIKELSPSKVLDVNGSEEPIFIANSSSHKEDCQDLVGHETVELSTRPVAFTPEAPLMKATNLVGNSVPSMSFDLVQDNIFGVLGTTPEADPHTQVSTQLTSTEKSPSLAGLTESSKRLSDIVASLEGLPQLNRCAQIFSHQSGLNYENDIGDSEDTHSRTTRGGRSIKPSLKIQEMEWQVVGKGNRGRRGRGRGININMN